MRALEAVVERGEHETAAQQRLPETEILLEQIAMQRVQVGGRHVDLAERVLRLLHFVAVAHLAVLHPRRPLEIEDVIDILQRHREALEAVGQLDGNW